MTWLDLDSESDAGTGTTLLGRRTEVRGARLLREEVVRPQRTIKGKGKEVSHSLPLSTYSAPGGLRQGPGGAAESPAEAGICGTGSREVRVLLSTYGSRGDVEPLVGLAVELRALGAEVRVCAPPDEDFARLLAGVGVPMVAVGPSARALTTATPPPSSACLPRRAADLIAGQFDAVTAAAEGCDALMATGAIPAAAGARSVAEKPGIRSVSVTFQQLTLPLPHHSPLAYSGRPFPPEVSDNRVLWDLDAQSINALFGEALNTNRASIGLPPVDNVRDYVIGDQPWLATGPDPGSVAGNAGPRRRYRPDRGSCRTFAHSRRRWWRSWTPAHHRCTWASAVCPCARRRTPPRWPSRRSGRRAAAHSSPRAGRAWP
ncbi:glycosyltransferase [Streptomyces sp. NPDC058255]|uniref:glycosyltransferase n=1 Tax=Streptomyces sp. NPDC058255 TaxID=3346407 RepID=UPI0036EE1EA3